MLKVILDTNALMTPFEMGFNLQAELETAFVGEQGYSLLLPKSIIEELRGLAGKGRWEAKAALKMVEGLGGIEVVDTVGRGDDAIVELVSEAGKGAFVVFTNDRELMKRLRKKGVRILKVRGKRHLELE